MKKSVSIILVLSLGMLLTATLVEAGSRYYHYGHSNYYRHPYTYRPYHRPYHSHSYLLPLLGVGLVAGAVAGSMMYEPPSRQTIVYRTPPPVIIQSEPITYSSQPAPVAPPQEVILRQVKVTERIVNVRSGPGLDSTIIGQAVAGQTLDVIGAAPEWLYIRMDNGLYGWVMAQYTVESANPVG